MTTVSLLFCLTLSLPAAPIEARATPRETLAGTSSTLQTDQNRLATTGQTRRKQPQSIKRQRPLRKPDVIYYPTPDEAVIEMLRLADIKPGDVLYDLGSGDGRIPIMAAKQYGIRAVGIEIDPKMITVAETEASEAGVENLVTFRNEDMFRTNIGEASVVTLYLSNKLNLLLRPKLLSELRPGSRILSHDFHMGDWKAARTIRVPWQKGLYRTIYFWRVPARVTKGRVKRST